MQNLISAIFPVYQMRLRKQIHQPNAPDLTIRKDHCEQWKIEHRDQVSITSIPYSSEHKNVMFRQ